METACPACTFLNPAGKTKCEMCETPLPAPAAAPVTAVPKAAPAPAPGALRNTSSHAAFFLFSDLTVTPLCSPEGNRRSTACSPARPSKRVNRGRGKGSHLLALVKWLPTTVFVTMLLQGAEALRKLLVEVKTAQDPDTPRHLFKVTLPHLRSLL
jgi:hypothetical protein